MGFNNMTRHVKSHDFTGTWGYAGHISGTWTWPSRGTWQSSSLTEEDEQVGNGGSVSSSNSRIDWTIKVKPMITQSGFGGLNRLPTYYTLYIEPTLDVCFHTTFILFASWMVVSTNNILRDAERKSSKRWRQMPFDCTRKSVKARMCVCVCYQLFNFALYYQLSFSNSESNRPGWFPFFPRTSHPTNTF